MVREACQQLHRKLWIKICMVVWQQRTTLCPGGPVHGRRGHGQSEAPAAPAPLLQDLVGLSVVHAQTRERLGRVVDMYDGTGAAHLPRPATRVCHRC